MLVFVEGLFNDRSYRKIENRGTFTCVTETAVQYKGGNVSQGSRQPAGKVRPLTGYCDYCDCCYHRLGPVAVLYSFRVAIAASCSGGLDGRALLGLGKRPFR